MIQDILLKRIAREVRRTKAVEGEVTTRVFEGQMVIDEVTVRDETTIKDEATAIALILEDEEIM
jgi:hypothetical protein